jgi:hypothetical protein
MAKLFQLLAVVLAGIAAYFLWTSQAEAAFVTVVLGVVSFFFGVRVDLKERNRIHKAEREANEIEDEKPVD